MKSIFEKTRLVVALGAALGVSANVQAATVSLSWSGAFTMLGAAGNVVYSTSTASCYPGNIASTNQCARTAITGSLTFDTVTGAGSADITTFDWFEDGVPAEFTTISLQSVGNGSGGPGTLMLGNLTWDWNGNYGIPVSIVWDASGLFSALAGGVSVGQSLTGGALPASDNSYVYGAISTLGPALMATTTWNTTSIDTPVLGTNPSGTLPLITDTVVDVTNSDIGIGGSEMRTGPWQRYNMNIDIVSATVTSVVPVPSAVWLFGSGLAGLVSLARRRRGLTAKRVG